MTNPKMLSVVSFMIALALGGCVSRQTHELAMEELKQTNQTSAQEIERLEGLVQQSQAKQRIQEEELGVLKEERETLTSGILALKETIGNTSESNDLIGPSSSTEPLNYESLSRALQQLRTDLAGQNNNFLRLRSERENLIQEVDELEARLADIVKQSTSQANLLQRQEEERTRLIQQVEALKLETGKTKEAKKREAAKLAKIQRERQAIEGDIGQVANTFKQQIGEDLQVQQQKDRLVLTVLGKVLFESGKAQLTPLGLEVMGQIAQVLSKFPNKFIHVEGHTDTRPIFGKLQKKYPTNWELSTARATTVLRFLIKQTKLSPNHFVAAGYADTHPVETNETEEGRSRNRRVEIVLYPQAMFSAVTEP